MVLNVMDKEIHFIVDEISENENLNEILMELLIPENHKKKLKVFIKCFGGSISVMIELLNVFKNYKKIETYLLSDAQSAATFLFLAGKKRIAYQYTIFMAHEPSVNFNFNYPNIDRKINSWKNKVEKLVKLYKPYFSKKEIKKIMNGKEVYLNENEMLERGIATEIR